MYAKLDAVVKRIYAAFGWTPRLVAPVLGRYVYAAMKREAKRLAKGWTYEPNTHYEKNARALELEPAQERWSKFAAFELKWVSCEFLPVPE